MRAIAIAGALALLPACGSDSEGCDGDVYPSGSYRVTTTVLTDGGCGLDPVFTEVARIGDGGGVVTNDGSGPVWDCFDGSDDWPDACINEYTAACDVYGPEGDYLFTVNTRSVRTWEPGDGAFMELETRTVSDAATGDTVCRATLEREGTRIAP